MRNNLSASDEQLRKVVRERYTIAATQAMGTSNQEESACCGTDCCSSVAVIQQTTGTSNQEEGTCCGTSCCTTEDGGSITDNLYSELELENVPVLAALASRGCGNPTALAELKPGEKVLDLGSGGGIDVLLSARRVGPTGFAYGLDMTDAMLALAERNRVESGIENVRFLKGIIEAIPLPENSVDVVISNCVINLSADKGQVMREAYRVLVLGGRFAVSDIVFQGKIPEALQSDLEAWAGCIAGALEESDYRRLLHEAGFVDVEVEVTRRYALQDIADSGASNAVSLLSEQERAEVDGKFVSAFIRAHKPL